MSSSTMSAATAPAWTGQRVEVAPYALIRLSGLPSPTAPAAARRFGELAEALIARERDLRALAESLGQRLHDSRDQHELRFHRSVVLPLRRDVHNGRRPAPALRAALGDLPDRLPGLDTWLHLADQRELLRQRLADHTAAALAAERAVLAGLCAAEPLRRAVALSSAALLSGLDRAAAAGSTPDARARKAEPKILRYALRATTKTSPWSWFTTVGWGVWDEHDDVLDQTPAHPSTAVNRVLTAALDKALLARPEIRGRLTFRLAPALTVAGQEIGFRRDDPSISTIVLVHEQQVRLPRTRALDLVIAEVRAAGPAGRTAGQLAAALAGRLTGSDRGAAALTFVDRLVTEQMLVPIPPADPQTADPLPAVSALLADAGYPSLTETLATIRSAGAEFADLPSDRRPGALRDLNTAWTSVFSHVGAAPPEVPAIREDVTFPHPRRLGRRAGRDLRDDLVRLAPLVELFDIGPVLRSLLRRRVVDRYGPGGRCPVTEVVADGSRLWSAAAGIEPDGTLGPADDDWPLPPELRELAELRRVITSAARTGPRRDDEVRLTDTLLDRAAAALPEWLLHRPGSHSFFVQPYEITGGTTGWCLNRIGDGWGRYTSRFLTALDPRLAGAVTDQVRRHSAATPVQYRPVSAFNANLHPMLTAEEAGEDPAWSSLPIEDLELVHEPENNALRLRVAATGRPIDLLYLGFLLQPGLPDRAAPLYLDLGGSNAVLGHLAPTEPVEVDGRIVHRRSRLGYRDLTLVRGSWLLDAATVAALRDDLLRDGDVPVAAAARWAAALNLPRAVFVSGAGGDLLTDPQALRAYFQDPKPQFFDLGSALHLRCLAKTLGQFTGGIRLEEALPVPGTGPTGRRAAEFVVETYRTRR
ncbi:lantibiotic dehydratase [Actinoplanes sp. HUAS TT8]|uniref:lantibiotic dehydratase n=1 Tax=Actinoplanes sp. HUAS TT8 TaxID=3447453 RepID=UPI003F51E73C